MIVYNHLKRKFAHHKYRVEFIVLLIVAVITFGTRICLLQFPNIQLESGWETVSYWLGNILYTFYTAFGAFQFEGLPDLKDGIHILFYYIYMATSIYAGAMLLSLVTATVSYEIYSRIVIKLMCKRKRPKNERELYIFTDLNEYTITLAKSIAEKHIANGEKFEIIFSGNNLSPFERNNPLCIEVMKNGFLYYSHRHKEDTSLLKSLGLLKHSRRTPFFDRKKIHLLAFSLEESEYYADEVKNVKTIFSELRNILNYYNNYRKGKGKVINRVFRFYILTKENLPYEKYEAEKKLILQEFFATSVSPKLVKFADNVFGFKVKDKTALTALEKEEIIKKFNTLFSLNIVNESHLTARVFSKKRSEILSGKDQLVVDLLHEDNMYHALFLGFGNTNKKIVDQLYIDTASVDKNLNETFFCATVVDRTLADRMGIYSAEHPFYIVLEHLNDDIFEKPNIRNIFKDIPEAKKDNHVEIENSLAYRYEKIVAKLSKKYYGGDDKITKIKLPLISYIETSCTSDKFLNLLDRSTGDQKGKIQTFHTIVIALGDDDENINLANAIISDASDELIRAQNIRKIPQVIAVHIKKADNYFKLEQLKNAIFDKWGHLSDTLTIIGFGKIHELFSYELIVDEKYAKYIHSVYSDMSGLIYEFTEEKGKKDVIVNYEDAFKKLREYDAKIGENIDDTISYLFHRAEIKFGSQSEISWLKNDSFKKESNAQVLLSKNTMQAFYRNNDVPEEIKLKRLAANETIRWNRLHIANGWHYNKKRYDLLKMHDCITELDQVPEYKNLYDIVNVALLVNLDKLEQ